MRVIGYIRVSSEDQATSGLGLDAQRHAVVSEAASRGWSLVGWFSDTASAKSLRRPGLTDAIAMLERGEADVLMVSRLDRLSRSVLDFASVLERAQRNGWKVAALDFPADLTTPEGEAMAGMLMVFAQFERRLIGQRTSAALQAKIRSGEWDPVAQSTKITPEAASRIKELAEAGMKAPSICKVLINEGFPPPLKSWTPQHMREHMNRHGLRQTRAQLRATP